MRLFKTIKTEKMEAKKLLWRILIVYVISLTATVSDAQQDMSDTRREEIQRYFGYEALPYRYLSLPYDVSVNANQNGDFVDIGPLYLIFIPILILFFFVKRKRVLGALIFIMLSFLIVALSNGKILLNLNEFVENDRGKLAAFLLDSCHDLNCYMVSFCAYFYYLSHLIFDPINNLMTPVTGNADYITYPIVFTIFSSAVYFAAKNLQDKSDTLKVFCILFLLMTFFWMTFSAGIIWYGFPMLVLGMLLVFVLLKEVKTKDFRTYKFLSGSFYTVSFLWFFFVGAQRISAVNAGITAERMGKGMYQPFLFQYMAGSINEDELFDSFYPNLRTALKQINTETDTKIFRIGTSFSFFIEANSDRIQIDNQLGIFEKLYVELKNKHAIADALKASGFKYIILDLNTPFIDKTPEQTLQKKFHNFMRFSKENQRLKLLSTNRVIVEKENGVPKYFYGIWGEIHYGGQYAVYELI